MIGGRYAKIIIPSLLVVAIVVGASAWLFGGLSGSKEITIKMREFAYELEDGDWPLILKAGENYKVRIVNIGAVKHEIMIVKDKDVVLKEIDGVLGGLENAEPREFEEAYEEAHHEVEEKLEDAGIMVGELGALEPGEETVVELRIDEPGTYWLVCVEVEGSIPQTHLHEGMASQLIVKP